VDYIQISPEAKIKIIELLQKKKQSEPSILGVLINLNQKGCAGLAYKIEYAKKDINLFTGYEILQFEEFDLFINPKIALYLIGTQMDYKNDRLESGFVFKV
jgi:iron-sulfur cluster assembly protein